MAQAVPSARRVCSRACGPFPSWEPCSVRSSASSSPSPTSTSGRHPCGSTRIDSEHRADLDRWCDGCPHWLRRHGDRTPGANGDRDVLGPRHASLVPRPFAEGDARGSRRHPDVLVLGAAADRRRLRPRRRRDPGRRVGVGVRAGLHRLLRSLHPPAETGRGRRGRRTRRARRRSRRLCAWPTGPTSGGISGRHAQIRRSSCEPAAAARSKLSIPTVSSSGRAGMAPSWSYRIR